MIASYLHDLIIDNNKLKTIVGGFYEDIGEFDNLTIVLPNGLKCLKIMNSNLKEFNIKLPSELEALFIQNNNIKIFSSVLNNTLYKFNISNNLLRKLNISTPRSLIYLDINKNFIKKLKLKKYPYWIDFDIKLIKNVKSFSKMMFYAPFYTNNGYPKFCNRK
jgi:Leucine-rich repeat (LRR) protein